MQVTEHTDELSNLEKELETCKESLEHLLKMALNDKTQATMLRSSIDSFNGKKDELESQIAETKQALAAAEEAAAAEAEAEEAAAAGAATALAEQKHKGRKEKGKAVAATASAVYIDRKELDDIKAVLRNLALLYKKRLKRTQRMVKGAYICLYFTFLELLTF